MTTLREAAQQAMDALTNAQDALHNCQIVLEAKPLTGFSKVCHGANILALEAGHDALEALSQALAKPESEGLVDCGECRTGCRGKCRKATAKPESEPSDREALIAEVCEYRGHITEASGVHPLMCRIVDRLEADAQEIGHLSALVASYKGFLEEALQELNKRSK